LQPPDEMPCYTSIDALPPPTTPDPGVPAEWTLLILVILLAAFEVWALVTGHNTISHLFQRLSNAHGWLKWVGLAGVVALWWHLFIGF